MKTEMGGKVASGEKRESIRVFLIDDNQIFTEVIGTLLRACEDIEFAGAAANLEQALDQIRCSSIDVTLIDATMNEGLALEWTREVTETCPETKIIILGLENSESAILLFIEAGASGYILQENSFGEFISTIKLAHAGETVCSPRVAALVFSRLWELSRDRVEGRSNPVNLTRRQKHILQLLAAGLANKQIAQQLRLSVSTVKNHVHRIFEKLQAHHRREAVLLAYESGILTGGWPLRLGFADGHADKSGL